MSVFIELFIPPLLGILIGCGIVIFANWIHLGAFVLEVLR
jgi:hypothetical protein